MSSFSLSAASATPRAATARLRAWMTFSSVSCSNCISPLTARDEVRDQVVPALQLDVDLLPGVGDLVA